MRLASLRDSSRDGSLIVVSQDGLGFAPARAIAKNLQVALDSWDDTLPLLHGLALDLERGNVESHKLQPTSLLAPLPRAYEWIDGSAYLHHVRLVRKARGAEPPESLTTDPLVYQGGSGVLLAPTADLPLPDPSWGLDFEAEVCIVVGDTPLGVNAVEAEKYIRLVLLANDVTFRSLVPSELKKGFGFVQSKPASAFSPFALTPCRLCSTSIAEGTDSTGVLSMRSNTQSWIASARSAGEGGPAAEPPAPVTPRPETMDSACATISGWSDWT
jgi:fumarylacetoacetate (FAA) hydrolase